MPDTAGTKFCTLKYRISRFH